MQRGSVHVGGAVHRAQNGIIPPPSLLPLSQNSPRQKGEPVDELNSVITNQLSVISYQLSPMRWSKRLLEQVSFLRGAQRPWEWYYTRDPLTVQPCTAGGGRMIDIGSGTFWRNHPITRIEKGRRSLARKMERGKERKPFTFQRAPPSREGEPFFREAIMTFSEFTNGISSGIKTLLNFRPIFLIIVHNKIDCLGLD